MRCIVRMLHIDLSRSSENLTKCWTNVASNYISNLGDVYTPTYTVAMPIPAPHIFERSLYIGLDLASLRREKPSRKIYFQTIKPYIYIYPVPLVHHNGVTKDRAWE